ncbi:MAG: 16S rRNA (uracil(1498)-N(3))-methyltransferase [Bacteroidales bacterium]|nr:16S rRNA (uracil(1498)-N(3))-methyltransferase [Bacteroidales bacterium]
MQLFFDSQLEALELEIGSEILLPEEESVHAVRVLRHQLGDILKVTNGAGHLISGKIIALSKKECRLKIESMEYKPKSWSTKIHIAIAPTKNMARIEWFIEKATEIGIDEITPVICEHSERRNINMERLDNVMIAAMKQSLKLWAPKLNTPIKLDDYLELETGDCLRIAHLTDDSQQPHLAETIGQSGKTTILIGPEGDFSKMELELATKNGWQAVHLGSERLRTETAGLYALMAFHLNDSKT